MARFDRGLTSKSNIDQDRFPIGDTLRGERATLGKSLRDVETELRIKAHLIDAIENLDLTAFESPGFVSGYVRSYARYLNLDANDVFARFCEEAQFEPPVKLESASQRTTKKGTGLAGAAFAGNSNVAQERWWERLSPAGLASIFVFFLLLGGIGYGASVLVTEIQKVGIAPVPVAPQIAEAGPVLGLTDDTEGVANPEIEVSVTLDQPLAEIYRPELLEVPVLAPRDGPIGLIKHDGDLSLSLTGVPENTDAEGAAPQVTAATVTGVEIFAVQAAWVQVQSPTSGTIFEQILPEYTQYRVPLDVTDALLRAGNSGSVYLIVDGAAYGPVGSETGVAKNVPLNADDIPNLFDRVDVLVGYDPAATPVNLAQSN